MGSLHQFVMRILHSSPGKVVFGHVLLDGFRSFRGVGIHQPEIGFLLKFSGDALQFGSVAVRQRTIGTDKEQNVYVGMRSKRIQQREKK